ncbi:MAG: hypothetical protein AB7O59_23340 [Pirellulales bacterium]
MTRVVPNTSGEERHSGLTTGELDDALRLADPAALLVAPRILRRAIKHDAGIGGIGLRVPHRKTYVITRERLLAIVDLADLNLPLDAVLPETVILIGRPSAEDLSELSTQQALIKYWRQLFHARVHQTLDAAIAAGRLNDAEIKNRIAAIGATEFEEIRLVLRQEDYLLPPHDDRTTYIEFAAVYLELRYFLPSLLRDYFPGLFDLNHVDDVLRRDVDAAALLSATRLSGADMPDWQGDVPRSERLQFVDQVHDQQLAPKRLPAAKRSDRSARALVARADRARQSGNLVRAAILRTRAARVAGHELAHEAREAARGELARLARRLQAALKFTTTEAEEWSRSLGSLIDNTARGMWTPEARMLYDLQKVCVDHERGIYTLDVWGWIRSLGRRSLKRFLPGQRDVLISKHLHSAARRVRSVHLSHRARGRLLALLQTAVRRAEDNLRARFKPAIERALDKVKLLPRNPPERVARKKLVEEILDRIVERGFLTMSDLRDALSRNNLKLPDLASARQFLSGDQLLQADRQLAESLDGVYHGGEVYLRLPQRLSSLGFGTPLGRVLTRYIALPFGGAYIALEGLQHMIILFEEVFRGGTVQLKLMNAWSVVLLGAFLFGLLYNHRFRVAILDGALRTGHSLRRLLVDLPSWLLRLPLVERIVRSREFRLFIAFVAKPFVVSLFAGLLIAAVSDMEVTLLSALGIFLVINLLLNSPVGRDVDEMVTDWFVHTWHRIRIHVIAAVFRFVMDLFNRILETIERLLYTVDEWLRFRAGERRSATVAKVLLGGVWFVVNYLIRFCVTLLIEPQINPIKHFPVVTVSHKFLLPWLFPLQQALAAPLGPWWASAIAGPVIFLVPGMFGFLVWELKENWRLYEANRPPDLGKEQIGKHGETVLQLLRIGFRSGTIPKLYAKLRRAKRKALYTDNWKASSKFVDSLNHVAKEVRRFVDRELLEVLHESRSWADRSVASGEIRLACNRIQIELYYADLGEQSMWLEFEEQSGWLVASIPRRGWADALPQKRRHTLASALAGFYKMAGVALVREQIEARLEPGSRGYEVTDDALLVWSSDNRLRRAYRLSEWPSVNGHIEALDVLPDVSPTDRPQWVFAATDITWRRWVITWELDQLEGGSKHEVLENVVVLPG